MPNSNAHPRQKTAFVTGASGGIGRAAAVALANAGYRVIGTSRRAASGSVRDGTQMIACDVTSDESVAEAVAQAHAELGQIDLLVNNAGVGLTGAAEESSIAQVRSLFETNFHGTVRVTNAVLPIMREQRAGRILNVGSAGGLAPMPYMAYYSATKHALEGYSESLDHEVREFGVRVAVIEPAATRTSFESSTVNADGTVDAYAASRAKYLVAFERAMAIAGTAESVAETIVLAALDKAPRLRYASGKDGRQIAFARRFLPRSLFDKIVRKQFGLG
ncbi:short-chain dehydrogenase/reductase [Bradyrhizobium sp. SSBR45G]|uniref:oxidoreductase n=1 Tax=unclassified Bradyrhizobium TaxID=2631580 RepID=UPI00234294EF|nr:MULTISPECIES: oxidoreductase [unclassified Bradyrhizobium]GLH80201.1 short-chain dehydrogenase/reductase [Bradyrhizobium sp. SSBR45G]GLH87694.1 short-chain dehydrogenase/reductase [Bradyrhizobium sp. SSBR45R]